MWYRHQQGLLDLGEVLSEETTAGRVQQWVIGVGLAGCLSIYSIMCLMSQRATFLRAGRPTRIIELQGPDAIAAGVLYLSAAVFMHCHWFWSAHPRYHGYAKLGKVAGLIGIVGGLGYISCSFLQLI